MSQIANKQDDSGSQLLKNQLLKRWRLAKIKPLVKVKPPALGKGFALGIMLVFAHTSALAAEQTSTQAAKVTVQAVPAQTLTAINTHAQKVAAFYRQDNPQFGLNEASIKALEQVATLYLAMPRSQADTSQFVQRYGSFYGQTLIQLYGGKWVYVNGGLGIQGKHGTFAYPFASIINRLTKNTPNSIYKDMMTYKQINSMSEAQFKQALSGK